MTYQVILVDGDNVAWKNYYANSKLWFNGMHTGAIFGFMRSILALLKQHKEAELIITWTHDNSYRKTLYPQYKEHRKDKTDDRKDYFIQQNAIEELLTAAGITQIKIPGMEADDIIKLVAEDCEISEENCLIISQDKDLLQLLSDTTHVLRHQKIYDVEDFQDEFNFNPKDIAFYLSMVGDKSDSIPGILSIGPKKATKLITEYGGYHHFKELKDSGLPGPTNEAKKVLDDWETIERNIKLIDLQGVPIKDPKDNVLYSDVNTDKVIEILSKYGLASIVKDVMEIANENKN